MIKTVGAVLILLGAAGLGNFYSSRLSARIRLLEEMRLLVFFLKGEILYANSSLQEAFRKGGERLGGELGEFAGRVAERLGQRQGTAFGRIWEEETAFLENLPFSREDLSRLRDFGSQLGYLDRQMQERILLLCLEWLERTADALREKKREASRLYMGLSLGGGLFFVIIMY